MSREPTQMNLPEKKSQLSMASTIRLVDWLRKQELTDTTTSRLATAAEAALNMRVTDNNVRAALDAAGLRITAAASLEEQNAAKLDAIAAALIWLYDSAGHAGVLDVHDEFVAAFGAPFIRTVREGA